MTEVSLSSSENSQLSPNTMEERKQRRKLRKAYQDLQRRWRYTLRQLANPGITRKKEQAAIVQELALLVMQAPHLLPEKEVDGWREVLQQLEIHARGARTHRLQLMRLERGRQKPF